MTNNFASVLWWARSTRNAAAWIPCMLSLEGQRVELVSERGVELACDVSDLRIEITGLSALRLVGVEKEFVLSAVGGRTVLLPLPSLEKRLSIFRAAHPGGPSESMIDPIAQWQKLLVEAGAQRSGRSRSRLRLLWGVAVCVFAAFLAAIGILVGLLAAR
ncbi:hypothetical protein [Leifsonia sp. 2MCAF36]|uniref:hypothetical protein n=1 Tax=Leifsonia sp. 2MCAF36 TaxID=3232988 RepID=UPI003F97641F